MGTPKASSGPVSIQLGPEGHKARELAGFYAPPGHLPLKVLHEVPGLVAFVGVTDEKQRVLDATPIFIGTEVLTPARAGIVLLCDLARDFTVEERLSRGNFTLGNIDALDRHVLDTYGKTTVDYLAHRYLGKPLGVEIARFLAARQTRILRVNYPELRKDAKQDKSRILLVKPFAVLAKFDPERKCKSVLELALYLGATWTTAENTLLRKRPELADRSKYFGDGPEPQAA